MTVNAEAMQETKQCSKCRVIKPLSEFHKKQRVCKECNKQYYAANMDNIREYKKQYHIDNKKRIRERVKKHYVVNKEKIKEKVKAYIAANKEKRSEYLKKYQKNNSEAFRARNAKRRAIKRTAVGSHTKNDILNLLVLQKSKCAVCHCSIKNGYHVDHIVPLAKGGSNDKFNLQLLCQPCNQSKHAKDPFHFMQQRGFLL